MKKPCPRCDDTGMTCDDRVPCSEDCRFNKKENAMTIITKPGKYLTRKGLVADIDSVGEYTCSGFLPGQRAPTAWFRSGRYWDDRAEADVDIIAPAPEKLIVPEFWRASNNGIDWVFLYRARPSNFKYVQHIPSCELEAEK